jgi:hypothetical protein
LDGSTGLNQVIRHLNLSVLPAHARDIFTWKNLKIHRIFLLYFSYFTMFLLPAFPVITGILKLMIENRYEPIPVQNIKHLSRDDNGKYYQR